MKVLAASDVHGAHETYAWLAEVCARRRVEALVLAGDLLEGSPDLPVEIAQSRDAEAVLDLLEQADCPILYIMGNDDLVELPARSTRFVPLHGRRQEFGPFNFVGYQYSLPFMAGVFEKPESEIAADLASLAPLVDERTVLVTHSPAYGILDLGILDRHAGSTSVLEVVARAARRTGARSRPGVPPH
jgi:Icc-related predicted phosphoesterase